jgi:hypothetical protein
VPKREHRVDHRFSDCDGRARTLTRSDARRPRSAPRAALRCAALRCGGATAPVLSPPAVMKLDHFDVAYGASLTHGVGP